MRIQKHIQDIESRLDQSSLLGGDFHASNSKLLAGHKEGLVLNIENLLNLWSYMRKQEMEVDPIVSPKKQKLMNISE